MKNWLTCLLSASVLGVAAAAHGQDVTVASPAAQEPVQAVQPPGDFSHSAGEVLKLHQAGIGDEVIRGFVANWNYKFQLSAADIVYLHQAGVSGPVITGMILRDQQLRESAPAPQYAAQAPVAAPSADLAQPEQPAQPQVVVAGSAPPVSYSYAAPQPVYVYPSYPSYAYSYPYYPYYYGPSFGVSIGIGSRFGYGGRYGGGHFGGYGGGHGGGHGGGRR